MLTFSALSYGPEVADLRATTGRVIAVLRQAIYLETVEGEIIGLAGPDAPDGPLTLRVPDLALLQAAVHDMPAAPFRLADKILNLVEHFQIDWSDADQWVATYPHSWSGDTSAAEKALMAMIVESNSQEGLGRLAALLPTLSTTANDPRIANDPLLRRAAPTLAAFLRAAEEGQTGPATDALISLLGLGPGLTPSGDDLVAGSLAVLAWGIRQDSLSLEGRGGGEGGKLPHPDPGYREGWSASSEPGARGDIAPHPLPPAPLRGEGVLDASALIAAVRAAATQRTNRISARLLWHAGAGTLYAPALDLGAALLAGDSAGIAAPARRLFAIGHTSGVDLAVGLLVGVRLLARLG